MKGELYTAKADIEQSGNFGPRVQSTIKSVYSGDVNIPWLHSGTEKLHNLHILRFISFSAFDALLGEHKRREWVQRLSKQLDLTFILCTH